MIRLQQAFLGNGRSVIPFGCRIFAMHLKLGKGANNISVIGIFS